MSLMHVHFFSKMLSRKTEVSVMVPDHAQMRGDKWPVMWLLHGAMGGHSDWDRNTMIELYAEKYGFAVVMASAANSFYANIPTGRYFDFLTEELPTMLSRMLPISSKREDNLVAGFSMGGHGAYKLGLTRPDKYAGIIVFSAGNFIETSEMPEDSPFGQIHQYVFGTTHINSLLNTEHDVKYLAKKAVENGSILPKLFVCCGTEDGGFPVVKSTFGYMKDLVFDAEWHEESGAHDWFFINKMLPLATEWGYDVLNKKG